VELSTFTAHLNDQQVNLHWETASETSNAGFEVQHRGPETEDYAVVGFVEGAGTTTEPQSYRFRAPDLAPGTHRFRLRQVDVWGASTVTEAVTVTVEAARALTLEAKGPNPVREATQFAFTVQQSGETTVTLYNVLGQRVRQLHVAKATVGERYTVEVAASDLPSGTYFVRLAAPSGTRTERMVVVR